MLHVIRLIALRHAAVNKLRSLLTVFGIVLGVAVVFAIHAVNRSVMASFRASVESVSGKATLVVGSGTGLAEELLDAVRLVPGVQAAAPVIEDSVRDLGHGVVLAVLGIDSVADKEVRDYETFAGDVRVDDELAFLNDPHGVLVTQAYAARFGLRVGDVLKLETSQGVHDFNVRGTLSPRGPARAFGGDVLVMDVFAAQIALGRGRRFDRVDVVTAPGVRVAEAARRIAAALKGGVPVTRPEQRSEEAERLLSSFKLALSLTSLVAIFVGGFIVYNALAIAIAQRRREIGVLRALGMTRGGVRLLFVGEGLLMGVLGAALGICLGLALARATLSLVGETVSALYMKVQPEAVVVKPVDVLLAGALGVLAATLAAWFPARRAARVDPVLAMQKKPDAADVSFGSLRAAALTCATTLGIAGVCALFAHAHESPSLGHLVAGLLLFAMAFAAPLIASGVGRVGEWLLGPLGPSSLLGSLSFRRDAGRSSVAIAALGMALGNVVTIDALLSSMKSSTHDWLGRSFRADLFVLAGTDVRAKFEQPMAASLGEILAADADVAFVQAFRMARQSYRGEPYYLMSEDLRGYLTHNELAVSEGDFGEAAPAMMRGESVGISQTFATRFHMGVGDTLELASAEGPQRLKVALVYVEYRTDIAAVLIERRVYTRLFHDSLVDLYGVYLQPNKSASALRARVLPALTSHGKLLVLENQAYVGELLGLIDRSLSLSYAAEAIAVLVAVIGLLNTLAVSVLDRKAELGTLRAIGASRAQVRRVVLTEAMLMGLSASLLGIGMGIMLSTYSVRESLRFELGWQLELTFSLPVMAGVIVLAQLVALVSAWLPMRSAADLDAAGALATE